jgi:hypothetical protein
MTRLPIAARIAAGGCFVMFLAGCANESKPPPGIPGAIIGDRLAASATAKLMKNLSSAQVLELLGPPGNRKPFGATELQGEIWSYPFRGATDVRMVIIATQDVPAINPLTGQTTTRSEPVYQNQNVEVTDTLHLLLVDDRLIEWRVVRTEDKKFQ